MKKEFDWEGYRHACMNLTPNPDKVKEVLNMEKRETKGLPGKRMRFAAAAVITALLGCSAVGFAAAEKIKAVLIQPKTNAAAELRGTLEKDGKAYRFRMEEKEQAARPLTLAEKLHVLATADVERGKVLLILGEEERDITEAMQKNGSYEIKWEQNGEQYYVAVSGGMENPQASVTKVAD